MACTGDKCERNGLYLVSGACGHAAQRAARRAQLLPACPICGARAEWTLLREFFARAEESDQDKPCVGGPNLGSLSVASASQLGNIHARLDQSFLDDRCHVPATADDDILQARIDGI